MSINDGLLNRWSATLDPNQSGSIATALSGSIDGVLTDGLGWVPISGAGGTTAFGSDDANSYLSLPGIDQTDQWTVAFWLYRRDSQNVNIFSIEPATFENRARMFISGNPAEYKCGSGSSSRFGTRPDFQSWTHVAFVVDGLAESFKVYLNGSLDVDDATVGPWLPQVNIQTARFLLTQSGAGGGTSYIDTIRIYNRALLQAEVDQLNLAQRNESGLNLTPQTPPSISGDTEVGSTLTATPGVWS